MAAVFIRFDCFLETVDPSPHSHLTHLSMRVKNLFLFALALLPIMTGGFVLIGYQLTDYFS